MGPGSGYADVCRIGIRSRREMNFWPGFSLVRRVAGHLAKKEPLNRPDGSWMTRLIRNIALRPVLFLLHYYIAPLLALFTALIVEVRSPYQAMMNLHVSSQPLSCALRA